MSAESLSKYEKETIINFNEEEKFASVYTCSNYVMNKLDKLCEKFPDNYKLVSQTENSKTYNVMPKKLIAFRMPKILTEEQKLELKDRLAKNIKKDDV